MRKIKRVPEKSSKIMKVLFMEEQDGFCALCEGRMTKEFNAPDGASFDHLTPRSLGGSNSVRNLVLVHKSCNRKRGAQPFPFEKRGAVMAVQCRVHRRLKDHYRDHAFVDVLHRASR